MTSVDYSGIERASGLDALASERVEELVRTLVMSAAKNRVLDVYRDGTVDIKKCAEKVPQGTVLDAACPWGSVAVQSIVERSHFDGYTFPDQEGEAARRMRELARGNVTPSRYSRALKSGVTYGVAFVTVGRDPRARRPVARWHTAKSATGIWDYGRGQLECGMAVVETARRKGSSEIQPTKVDMYDDRGVWQITRRLDWTGWDAVYLEHPMGEPMMLAMPFLPDDESPLGHTRLSSAVRHIIREYLANALNTHVASAFYAIGQKAIMNLTKQQFDMLKDSKDGLAVESIFLGMMDKNGNSPRLDQWQQQSMEPLLSVRRALAQDFCAATSVPVSELISQDSNPTSAEALVAAKDKLISLVESVNEDNREVLRRVAMMLMAVDGDVGLDGLSEDQMAVSAHMRSPSTPSAAAMADSQLKIAQTIEGYGESDVCLERLGFDEGERYRIQAAQRKRQARMGASAILDRNRMEVGAGEDQSRGGEPLPTQVGGVQG